MPTTEQAAEPKEGEAAAGGEKAPPPRRGDKAAKPAAKPETNRREGREKDQEVIRLVVGLGNPGKEYEHTRHNAGFWLVERFAQASGFTLRKDPKFKALVGKNAGGAWFLCRSPS